MINQQPAIVDQAHTRSPSFLQDRVDGGNHLS